MSKHVMLDIETMGTGNNAMIVSIGAVKFDGLEVLDMFHMNTKWDSGDIGPQTVKWWIKQSNEAIGSLFDQIIPVDMTRVVLEKLVQFIEDCCVWGNGVDFDNVIVINACKREGVNHWSYRKNRCFRTIKNIFDPTGELYVKPRVAHDALEDALAQTKYLMSMAERFNIPL